MTFAEKIRKVFGTDGWHSVAAGARRMAYPLDWRQFMEPIDREGVETLRAKYYTPGERLLPAKYLNVEEWMKTSVKRIRDLRIMKAPPRLRVLDLGCGTGYFLHVAKCLGHDVLGLDLDVEPVFRGMLAVLGIPRVIHAIHAFQPLPDLGAPFDLITAHMTCFNRRDDGSHWGVAEWEYFVKDAESRLTPAGRLQFDLNVLPDGRHMEDDVREFFRSRGARIERRRVYLPPCNAR
jgi:SAM-dependent methyltransferase